MPLVQNLQLTVSIAAFIITAFLAYAVYRNNPRSITNRIFTLLSVLTNVWLVVVYFSNSPQFFPTSIFWIRASIFLALPQSMLFWLLAEALPHEELDTRRRKLKLVLSLCIVLMAAAMSPFAFSGTKIVGESIVAIPGPGLPFIVAFLVGFSLAALYRLFKKLKTHSGSERQQIIIMLYGILLMLGLIIATILIPVAIFNNSTFVSFAPAYTLIFLGFTAYAIVKYRLFDLKVIATEAFSLILWVLFLSRAFLAESTSDRVISLFVLATTILFGILLIRSVRREVEQREQLQVLTKQLEDANDKLKALDQARAEFISIASHQLRTPPATIKWYLAALLSGDYGEMNTEVREIVQKAEITNNSLISLIDDMLNASRIERGTMEFLFEEADLEPLAQLTVDQLTPQSMMKKLKLTYNKPKDPLPHVMVDKEKLRQVMNNFIDNAIKYTKEGSITADLYQDGDSVVFKVTDTGKGIAIGEEESIFKKYSRGKDSINQAQGLGLGLYVAKVIIAQHKGKIWAESKGEGKGSSFLFSIPLHAKLDRTKLDFAQAK